MPLLKSQKKELAKHYKENVEKSINVVVLTFDKIPVNEINQIRMDIAAAQGVLQVVKKRILLKALDSSFEGLTLDEANATVMMLYAHNTEDEHAPLKVIQKYIKKRTKEKLDYKIDYVGGWYEKNRQQAAWVKQLASLPTKEELVGKFLFLLNHPVSSLARAFQAIADREGSSSPATEQTQPQESTAAPEATSDQSAAAADQPEEAPETAEESSAVQQEPVSAETSEEESPTSEVLSPEEAAAE